MKMPSACCGTCRVSPLCQRPPPQFATYDAAWVDRRVGQWLETFYNADIVAVFSADGQTEYFRSRIPDEAAPADLAAELGPILEILRSGLAGQLRRMVLVTPRDLSKPSSAVAVIQNFRGQPAIVAAVAIGSHDTTAIANDRVPIVTSIKYLNERLLARIAERLQVEDLHLAGPIGSADPSAAAAAIVDARLIDIADAQGTSIARLVWRPKLPGGAIVMSVVPFVAVALAAFALLIVFIMRHMQRTTAGSRPASASCGTLRCTSAGCRTGFVLASGWNAPSPRCATAD
jgi:sensor domain CHASE-containing protein